MIRKVKNVSREFTTPFDTPPDISGGVFFMFIAQYPRLTKVILPRYNTLIQSKKDHDALSKMQKIRRRYEKSKTDPAPGIQNR